MAEGKTQYQILEIPNTKTELYKYLRTKVFKNGVYSQTEKVNNESHPGIRSAYRAFNINRSPNTAYIYLLGVTGSGKSSTVNFLFDKKISPTGEETSETTDTIENISQIKDTRLLIKNLSINVIDGPGLEDTAGVETDTKNILCHQRFLETHPQLVSVKPNVVMITLKVTEDRLGGVINPQVVVTENCPDEHYDLKKDEHGWYDLRNGDKLPLTLFNTLIQLCKKSSDLIGQEAISKYFSQKSSASEIKQGHRFNRKDVIIDKSHEIVRKFTNIKMNLKETDISKKLDEKFNELPVEQQELLGTLTPRNVALFFQHNNITSFKDIPQDEAFLELFANYSEHSSELLHFLQDALKIRITKKKIDPKVGLCYNVMNDSILGNSIFKFDGKTKLTWTGFQMPDEIDIYEENSTFSRCEQFSSMEEYMRKRLADLSVYIDVSLVGLKVSIRDGYSVSSSQNFLEKTLLIERHCFRVTIDEDKLKLSDRFKSDIDELPDSYEQNNEVNVNRWKAFFDKYGTHIVKTAWGGGACTATVKIASSNSTEKDIHQLMVYIEDRLSGNGGNLACEGETESNVQKLFNTSSIHMEGGNPNYHATNLRVLASDNTNKWLASIQHRPSILTTKLELVPISSIVSLHRPSIRDTLSFVYKDLFGANLKYIPEKRKSTEPTEMNATSREDATNKTAPDHSSSSCITGGTMILMADGSECSIEQLKPGDLIVDKDGKTRKVLGTNQVLLANRSLYGFEPYTEPFFTSDHLFASENNKWICIDPYEAKRLNPQFRQLEIPKMKANCRVHKWNGYVSELKSVAITCNHSLPSSTMVYCLIVEGSTYIANGFVTKDSMPDLLMWPSFAICSALLLSSDSAQLLDQHLPTINSVKSANSIEMLAFKISLTWNETLQMYNHIKPSEEYNEVKIAEWMEKLANLTNLTNDEFPFITMILSKPSLTHLAQQLYINCGENIHNNLGRQLKNDKKIFVTLATQLCKSGESIICHHVNEMIEQMQFVPADNL